MYFYSSPGPLNRGASTKWEFPASLVATMADK